jgi:hypothetical protein
VGVADGDLLEEESVEGCVGDVGDRGVGDTEPGEFAAGSPAVVVAELVDAGGGAPERRRDSRMSSY